MKNCTVFINPDNYRVNGFSYEIYTERFSLRELIVETLNMIENQRAYEANARVVNVADQMLATLINMVDR